MVNVLVIGKGYVGNEVNRLLNRCNIHFTSRNDLDYHDQGVLRRYIGNNNIKYVINCSGFTGRPNVDECEDRKEECSLLNVFLPLKIAESCKVLDVNYIHISSGCIYGGYEKVYTEEDVPDFGFYSSISSFYSKTKHLYEILTTTGLTLRIRMPFTPYLNNRNYLNKLIKYDTLLNLVNSKTYLPDVCSLIQHIIDNEIYVNNIGPLNFVNPKPQSTKDVVRRINEYSLIDVSTKLFVDSVEGINTKAGRSNCVLSIDKLNKLFPEFYLQTEDSALTEALTTISQSQ
jgi:dTDP-4-dehydrorhamnose reductase